MLISEGFKRKRYFDFMEDMSEQAKKLFGEDVNLSERSALGKFVSLIAYARAEENELAEEVYNSRFVDTSEGVSLENNVKRALIKRKTWLKATEYVQLTLEKGSEVKRGTLIGTNYGVLFETLSDVKAEESGIFDVRALALEYGFIGNVKVGDVTKIINPATGFISVTNDKPFLNGQDEETDGGLQERYYRSLGKAGNRRVESIRARILDEVEGVRACIVIENDKMEPDSDRRPPKSFETIVLGGLPDALARKIYEAKPGGIQAYGSTVKQVEDAKGKMHDVGFSYAESLQLYIQAQVRKGKNYPLDGDEQVKKQLVQFVGGTISDVVYTGLGMNENVVLAKLEAQLFRVEGVEDVKLALSTDGLIYVEENIDIGFAQVAETDSSKVEVSHLVN